MSGRPVRGEAALKRALRAELTPLFGTLPFTVAVEPVPLGAGRTDRLVCIAWPGPPPYAYWHPAPASLVGDARGRGVLVRTIGAALRRTHVPYWRRLVQGASA